MLIESVRITSVEPGFLRLQPYNTGSCQSCKLTPSCGQYLLNSIRKERELELPLALLDENTDFAELKNGSHAQIMMAAGKLVKLSFLLYLFPLFAMLITALLAGFGGFHELTVVLLAFISLILSYKLLHNYLGKQLNLEYLDICLLLVSPNLDQEIS